MEQSERVNEKAAALSSGRDCSTNHTNHPDPLFTLITLLFFPSQAHTADFTLFTLADDPSPPASSATDQHARSGRDSSTLSTAA